PGTYHVLYPPRTISFGDESSVNAIGDGTVILQATIGKKDYNIALSNVLLVPNFIRHVIFNESRKVQKDDTAPWNTDTSTDQWEGLIPENAHYPDQKTLEEDDPDPWIRDPNELQMEPYQHEDVPRAVGQYLRGDVPRAVGAPNQLRYPPQQSLQPRHEHWPSSEWKAKVELHPNTARQPVHWISFWKAYNTSEE
ncbi:hypothetical protein SERLA73DRAFT_80422, partial [Serpula lacrymans var. lacrymans S7.3]